MNDPAWLRHIGDKRVRTLDDARVYITNWPMASLERLGFGLDLVELKVDATPIGICGLLRRDPLTEIDMGFACMPPFQGSGYAFESAVAVLRHAKELLAVPRITAIVSPHNHDSIRVLEKLGLRFEKMARLHAQSPELAIIRSRASLAQRRQRSKIRRRTAFRSAPSRASPAHSSPLPASRRATARRRPFAPLRRRARRDTPARPPSPYRSMCALV